MHAIPFLIGLILKILIISLGSRGDVQPYVALGIGLQAADAAAALFQ